MKYPIELRHVTKSFRTGAHGAETFLQRIENALAPGVPPSPRTTVLSNVTLQASPGEWLGLIGQNGSGKTTLLKIIAGIYQPTNGTVKTTKPLVPLIGLGAGFHPDLSVRENIWLNGIALGLPSAALAACYQDIISFAEVSGKMATWPLKHLSAGMHMRVGFAVAMQTKPAVLLLDEVFAVGDEHFTMKAKAALVRLQESPTTVVFASHNVSDIQQMCHRVIYLSDGAIRYLGDPATAIAQYQRDVV